MDETSQLVPGPWASGKEAELGAWRAYCKTLAVKSLSSSHVVMYGRELTG